MSYIKNSNSTIAKNSVMLSLRMVVVLFLMLYTTRILLKSLGVTDYGIYNVVCGFVSLFSFLTTSLSNGIQRFFNYELGKNGTSGANVVYNAAFRIQLLIAFVLIALTESIGIWYISSKMVIPADRLFAAKCVFQASIVSLLFAIVQAPYVASILSHEKMGYYAIVTIIDATLKFLIARVLSFIHLDSLIIYGLMLAVESLLIFSLYFCFAKINFKEIKLTKGFSRNSFFSILSFSGWNVFGSFANIMREQGINMVMNLFFGPVINAARGVASQVNGGLQSLVSNLSVAIRPQVVQSYAIGDIHRSIKLTFSISKMSCCFLYLISLPIVIEIDYILRIWLGNVPPYTSVFIYIIILTSFVNNLNAAVSGIVHASGKMKKYQLVCGMITLTSVPLAFFVLKLGLAPYWALLMGFVATFVSQVAALIVLKGIVDYSIKEYTRVVVLPIIWVVLSSFWPPLIVHSLVPTGFFRLLIVLFVSLSCSLIAVYVLGLNHSEKEVISSIVNRYIHK